MASKIITKEKYGAWWDVRLSDAQIEMSCIKLGGQWKPRQGKTCGLGLYKHYLNLQYLLWPDLDDHRWHKLVLKTMSENQVTVLMGPASTAKTHEAAKLALCDYWSAPDETAILVSSTDIRGLELRVWGEIKMLFQQAKERYDWLAGHLIDSKHCITTDDIQEGEVRDLRKGIIGIPCIINNKFIGLKNYCFPDGTLVDTPNGPVPIENLSEGDVVFSAFGPDRILAASHRTAPLLVRITLRNGTIFDCTPNHPFLTQSGWVNAACISTSHRLISRYETMQILQGAHASSARESGILLQGMPEKKLGEGMSLVRKNVCSKRTESDFLLSVLWGDVETQPARDCGENDCWERLKGYGPRHQQNNYGQSIGEKTKKSSGQEVLKGIFQKRMDWLWVRRKAWAYQSGGYYFESVPGIEEQFRCSNWRERKAWKHSALSNRCGMAEYQARCGIGWWLSQETGTTTERQKEGCVSSGSWVDRVEILEQGSDPRYNQNQGGYRIHDLEIEGHPSFSVNGYIVHNSGIKNKRVRLIADECQFLPSSFLDGMSNLEKNPDFRAVFMGNPLDPMDSLGKAAEPEEGWDSIGEPDKTTTWKTRFKNGVCVNLVGTDSPNFDYPEDRPAKFPYLINRKTIEGTVKFYGMDSLQYYSQCKGVMKTGVLARRVITRELCRRNNAFESAIWKGGPTTKVASADIAYGNIGGDRAVFMWGEFGRDVQDHLILEIHAPEIIPVSVRNVGSPEDQISEYVKTQCQYLDVPPENFFYDSTGRGSMGTSFARIWSADVMALEFGGAPLDQPVCQDMFIKDEKTGQTRLKLCSEHYSKRVTQFWFSVRYTIESNQLRGMTQELMEEGCMREWKMVRGNKIELETKEDCKKRMGRSPDEFDACAVLVQAALQRGFKIARMAATSSIQPKAEFMERLRERAGSLRRSHELTYR